MEHTSTPAIFTIFGVTGDLAAKKIIPSLWYLHQERRLPKQVSVIGFARRPLSDTDFRELIRKAIEKMGTIADADFDDFFKMFSYQTGTFESADGFVALAARIKETEAMWGVCASKLLYLAVPSSSYESIFEHMAEVKLNLPCDEVMGWSRVLVEKPFGHDLSSARALDAMLARYFKEEQIYRIDHYLFKEIVQGIQSFRFSNNLFETHWGKENTERIDIRLHESIGVESRGSFYDSVGALRDVGQNHLLEMLAAITMEYPSAMDTTSVRQNREQILATLEPWTDESIRTNTFRAQYDGYRKIKGVQEGSETETCYALKTSLHHPRWTGVPIYMDSGKRMGESRKEIVLTLKHPKECFLCQVGSHGPNKITFRLEPNDEIIINFWTKKPGFEQVLEERAMSFFLYEKKNKVQYVEEYAKVIDTAIVGTQSLFASAKEVEALWAFVDPVVAGWKRGLSPLESYLPDTTPHPTVLDEIVNSEPLHPKGTIGFVGLGKMGTSLARRVQSQGWRVAGYNQEPDATKEFEREGLLDAVYNLPDLVKALTPNRTIWLMVPHNAVDSIIDELVPLLSTGDTIIDGGNSPYKESTRRHAKLAELGIRFLDVGVSGGPSGAKSGACIMVGGDQALFEHYEPLFRDLSVPDGYLYAGKGGAGHFVKMVHNGIEYGMMQAIAEGFTIMKRSPFELDVAAVAKLYNHGSVIESRLTGWLVNAYQTFGADLDNDTYASPAVAQTGEGQWTVDEARELDIPAPVIESALEFRKQSLKNPSYTGRILSALRNQFGGHGALGK